MKLVVAIDGPQCAETAVEHILNGKYGAGTKIYLIHVLVPGFAEMSVEGIPDVVAAERKEEQAVLENTASTLKEKLGAEVTTALITGETAEVIADACRQFGADEVIIPSQARHGFSRIWFGSVSDEIVDAVPCTAVVLKIGHDKMANAR